MRLPPSQLLVPVAIMALLVAAMVTGGRRTQDPHGRPTVVYAHPPCPPDLMVSCEKALEAFRAKHLDIIFEREGSGS